MFHDSARPGTTCVLSSGKVTRVSTTRRPTRFELRSVTCAGSRLTGSATRPTRSVPAGWAATGSTAKLTISATASVETRVRRAVMVSLLTRFGSTAATIHCAPRTHKPSARIALREMLAEPGQHLLPAVYRRVLAIERAVHREERVAGIVVGVEFVRLAVLLERGFRLRRVVGGRPRVLHAEQSKQRALQILGEVDGRHGLTGRQLLSHGDHASAIAVNGGIEAAERARGEVGLPAAGAIADDADLAVQIRQRAEIVDRALHVAHGAIIGHPAGRADARAVLLRGCLALPEMEVGRDRHEAMMSEAASDLLGRPVPARHVMDDDDAGERFAAKRSGEIGVDQVAVMPTHRHCLSHLAFVWHRSLLFLGGCR